MTLAVNIIQSLKSLPCFGKVDKISLLANGLSQTAIKVTTNNQIFFAKKLNQDTANTEISCSIFCALSTVVGSSGQRVSRQLSPDVVYHDKQWLVTEFIPGITLANSDHENKVKITTALTLMAELHQLDTSVTDHSILPLNPNLTIDRLLSNLSPFSAKQRHIIPDVSKCITAKINSLVKASGCNSVLCHGDLNFENILVDNERYWLVDFECAYLAPVEFDIAMFIAVNNIHTDELIAIVTAYFELNRHLHCNLELIHYYLLYSYFINGLWYLDNDSKENKNLYSRLAKEQWSSLDNYATENSIQIPKLLPLLS